MNELNALGSGSVYGKYTANAVTFDGTNDYLTRGADLTGVSDSKSLTFSVWIKPATLSNNYIYESTGGSGLFKLPSSGYFVCSFLDSAGTPILSGASTATAITANVWNHILFSCDLTDTGKRFLYINDVANTATYSRYTNTNIDFTRADHAIGAQVSSFGKYFGDMADLSLTLGTYTDISVEANRRLYITSTGKPVKPSSGIIVLTGATDSWHTNKGTGGGFTENGSLSTAPTSPSD